MKKIPTLLVRDPQDRKHVLNEVTPGCEWVIAGEGRATQKFDGTCVMFDGEHWWARREVKPGKTPPPNYRPEEHDEVTGKTVGWEPIEQSPFADLHRKAVGYEATRLTPSLQPGTYELCGPKINGNPEKSVLHFIVRHADAPYDEHWPFTPERLRDYVLAHAEQDGWEGVVWHHPDGRMAKLKARDLV